MKKIVDEMIPAIINIDERQYAFVPGCGPTDAIIIIRHLQEKILAWKDLNGKNHSLYFTFVDLKKRLIMYPARCTGGLCAF